MPSLYHSYHHHVLPTQGWYSIVLYMFGHFTVSLCFTFTLWPQTPACKPFLHLFVRNRTMSVCSGKDLGQTVLVIVRNLPTSSDINMNIAVVWTYLTPSYHAVCFDDHHSYEDDLQTTFAIRIEIDSNLDTYLKDHFPRIWARGILERMERGIRLSTRCWLIAARLGRVDGAHRDIPKKSQLFWDISWDMMTIWLMYRKCENDVEFPNLERSINLVCKPRTWTVLAANPGSLRSHSSHRTRWPVLDQVPQHTIHKKTVC